jgi:hypothetical protein
MNSVLLNYVQDMLVSVEEKNKKDLPLEETDRGGYSKAI